MLTPKEGSLTVVGTGINALAQCSLEAKSFIETADIVFALVTDPLTLSWLQELNVNVVNLQAHYQFVATTQDDGPDVARPRSQTYEAIAETICAAVYTGQRVVAVFYGHPGVFVYPSHAAIKRLRMEGYRAQMLPGISAEDCLFADLSIDPCTAGCAQHEATNFIFYKNNIDISAGLILWQLGVLGDYSMQRLRPANQALEVLTEKLLTLYPANHPVIVYEASNFPLGSPRIESIPLQQLPTAVITLASTLYVPPAVAAEPDQYYLERLALNQEEIARFSPPKTTHQGARHA